MIETELAKTNSNAAVRVKKTAEDLSIIFGIIIYIKKERWEGERREKKKRVYGKGRKRK